MSAFLSSKLATITLFLRPGGTGRQISWSVGQSLFEAGSMMVAALIAARVLGTVAWGQLGLILVGVQFITFASDGLMPGVVRLVSRHAQISAEQGVRAGRSLARTSLLLFVGVTIGVLAAAVAWNSARSEQMPLLWLLAGGLICISRIARTVYDSVFRGIQQFSIPAKAGIVCTGLMAAGILISVFKGYGVGAYLYVMAAALTANTAWLYLMLARERLSSGVSAVLDPGETREFFRFSMPLVLRGFILFLFLKVNVAIIGLTGDEDAAGQFRLTDQFLTVPTLLLASVSSVFAPKVVAHLDDKASLTRFLSRLYGFLLVFNIPFVMFFMGGGPLLEWLYPAYNMVPKMNLLFAPAVFAQCLWFGAVTVLLQAGHSKPVFWLSVIPSILNVVLAIAGLITFGTFGLVAATATVHFLTFIATVITTHQVMKLPFRVRFR